MHNYRQLSAGSKIEDADGWGSLMVTLEIADRWKLQS